MILGRWEDSEACGRPKDRSLSDEFYSPGHLLRTSKVFHSFHYVDGTPRLTGSITNFKFPDGGIHSIIGPSPNRRGLIFSCDLVNGTSCFIRPGTTLVTNTDGGFNVTAGQPPLFVRLEDWGSLVGENWFGSTNAGIGVITIVEVLEDNRA